MSYPLGMVVLGAGMLGSALAPSLGWALVSFFVTGAGSSASMNHDPGLLQHLVPARMLSRAFALVGTLEAWGFAVAALLGGALASTWGGRGVFAVAGTGALVVAAVASRTLLVKTAPALPEPSLT